VLAGVSTKSAAQSGSTAVRREDRAVAGLTAPASIVIDHWGIPHIYAASARDAFFVQGYNAARDRLWQIDLWRKRGLGLLAKSFGPSYWQQDRASRLLLYRGDMQKEWAAYPPIAHDAANAFAAGINAYVAEVRAGKRPLPPEFKLTASKPDLWRPEDIVRVRSHALVSNVKSEVARARVACVAGLEADRLRRKLEPTHTTVVPPGLNPCDVPADVLKVYLLATDQVSFAARTPTPTAVRETSPDARLAQAIAGEASEGSNNWVVAASRSATGRPILANDPHRQLGVPSLRYLVHLNAPGLSLIGAGEPALPGVSIGHNDQVGMGITIFPIDQEDLYVYELKPGAPRMVRYQDGFEAMRTVTEQIEVRGEKPRSVKLLYTRHGPVLWVDEKAGRAFALRTVWNEPGVAGYFGSSFMWEAKSWSDFRRGSNAWGAPPLNLVYADTRGDIGWSASGRTPVRPGWDGLMPVPGDGRYEWQGFLADDVLPSSLNPTEGWFATANEMNLPVGYPVEDRKISFEWTDRSRITRIKSVLSENSRVSLADSMALQCDSYSAQSVRLTALLRGVSSPQANVGKALALLKAWDHDVGIASAAAAIYEVWATKYLGKMTVAKVTPQAAIALVGDGSLEAVLTYLEHPDAALGEKPTAARDALLVASLSEALTELTQRLGPDMSSWTWGQLHHATFEPAAAVLAEPALRAQMSVGPLQVPGSASSPRAATYRGTDFAVTAGASVRMVLDVGNWDDSRVINTPGQSGDPWSAHYRDLFPRWAAGDYVPLLFSRAAVDAAAETVLTLTPKTSK
jgi:penicillin amidase